MDNDRFWLLSIFYIHIIKNGPRSAQSIIIYHLLFIEVFQIYRFLF